MRLGVIKSLHVALGRYIANAERSVLLICNNACSIQLRKGIPMFSSSWGFSGSIWQGPARTP